MSGGSMPSTRQLTKTSVVVERTATTPRPRFSIREGPVDDCRMRAAGAISETTTPRYKMLRMDAIFLCFILRPSKKAPTSALQRSPAALRKAASIGDEWDGEDALPWANRCPVYAISQTTKQSL